MPLNIPSGNTNDISFGPALVKMGVAGTTPSLDVGFISEDGVTLEIANETKDIVQGNPKLVEYTFSQTQGVNISFTSIEWDFTAFARVLGSGATTVTGTEETFMFGGDPLDTSIAIDIQHQMAVSGNTMNVYVWKAVAAGGLSVPFGADEHSFEMAFKAQRSATDWAGGTLPSNQQLVKFLRTL